MGYISYPRTVYAGYHSTAKYLGFSFFTYSRTFPLLTYTGVVQSELVVETTTVLRVLAVLLPIEKQLTSNSHSITGKPTWKEQHLANQGYAI